MEQETENKNCCGQKEGGKVSTCGASGAVYGLGFIGAAIFYIQHSNTFWIGVIGVLKAIVWPAFLVYKLAEFFKI